MTYLASGLCLADEGKAADVLTGRGQMPIVECDFLFRLIVDSG
jgi:hypothetical protein